MKVRGFPSHATICVVKVLAACLTAESLRSDFCRKKIAHNLAVDLYTRMSVTADENKLFVHRTLIKHKDHYNLRLESQARLCKIIQTLLRAYKTSEATKAFCIS